MVSGVGEVLVGCWEPWSDDDDDTGNLESLIGKNEEALVPTCVSDIRDIAVEKESDVEDEIWDTKGEWR